MHAWLEALPPTIAPEWPWPVCAASIELEGCGRCCAWPASVLCRLGDQAVPFCEGHGFVYRTSPGEWSRLERVEVLP